MADADRQTLEALWREHRSWVAAVVDTIRPRDVDLEDLLQEVALRFVRQIRSLRDAKRLRAWLRQIARNVCTDASRRTRLRRTEHAELDTIEIARGNLGTTSELESRDELARVRAAMTTLPEDMRELLALRAIDGLSQREIAATLDLPETTIETRLVRARRALRAALGPNKLSHLSSPRRCLQ